ncbi:MAG: hypothetical protein V4592_17340 [Bacteroidota bacterium]
MIINNKETNINELAIKVTESVNKALRKLVETAAANDESLVIGNYDGTSKSIPAKELLKTMPK